ncbi:unnamed protein product, partial [Nesidiocoris tenuis]
MLTLYGRVRIRERNLFSIWGIKVSLRNFGWDQAPGSSPYRSSGIWTGYLGCINMQGT